MSPLRHCYTLSEAWNSPELGCRGNGRRYLSNAPSSELWGERLSTEAVRRERDGLILSFPLVFTVFWLGYWMFRTVPWPHYALPLLTALFVVKLWYDLSNGFKLPYSALRDEIRHGRPRHTTATLTLLLALIAQTYFP